MELTSVKNYAVYRIEFLNKKMVRIGTLSERREKERDNNEAGILRLAQKLYAESSIEKMHIIVRPT
jgi:hypothetical protein